MACAKRKGAGCGIPIHVYTIFVVMITERENSRVSSLISSNGEEILHTQGKTTSKVNTPYYIWNERGQKSEKSTKR